ncbi:G-protein coupled receptor 182-like [Denticeps clupeoides]|uniref:G-protein coupled receptors family 1 profile domain-containing protein n=1 Tax=Denticeps clupeoides TaxID=299321 RepID=A0A8C4C154_9TELE|nr:G-protein coupled receptor 182-like [Denticeps clupeoides]XP_028824874.1 G-protein coupled receptor 182-like [Denticeps clupeoides]XP_028824885.1 G-protein coupled receptor 182-like [Denticeps clupeoides]XP_028824886.1 G-protein coupled receptor 182-like [Denticeps clupeoides]XP_028824887.1 G-protein coupled receptor 182-like [Denticeps clupeoides]
MSVEVELHHDLNNESANHSGMPWFTYECNLHLDYEYRRMALFLLYLLLFMAGLLENTLVLWVNWRRRRAASGVLFCIINISLSDLMVVLTLPFSMLEFAMDDVWIWGRFLCKFTYLVYMVNFYSSSFFLAFMTLERYLSLARPSAPSIFPRETRQRWLVCAGLWTLSLVLSLFENVHVNLVEWEEPGCFMWPEDNHNEWYATATCLGLIFQFLGPAAIIITCNVLISRAVATVPDVRDRRDVWLVHVYSLVFVLCWLPYHMVMFLLMLEDLNPYLYTCNTMEVLFFSFSVVESVTLFHCLANPVLYNFLSKSFHSNLINTVMQYLPQASGNVNVNGADNGAASKPGRTERKVSGGSTSQSDVDS